MEDARRKPKEQHRVPLNCLVRSDTMQEIRERAVNGKSQGQVIDEAVSALYRETGTAYEPQIVAADIVIPDEAEMGEPASEVLAKARDRIRRPHTLGLPSRPFKGPLLKPKDRK